MTADDPALADTRGLAMLLYAALTRYWPGPGMGSLPPAPLADGKPCSPHQVCAGVPASIDEVTCQALFQLERRRGPVLTTPGLFADALFEVIPAPMAPPPAAAPAYSFTQEYQPDSGPAEYGGGGGAWAPAPHQQQRRRPPRPAGSRTPGSRAVIALIVLLVLAAIGTGLYSLSRHNGGGSASPGTSASGHSSSPVANTVLTPVNATASDNAAQARGAFATNPANAWNTQFYLNNPVFGGLKSGTGLLLDMGKSVTLSSVQLTFGPTAGTNLTIEIGNQPGLTPGAWPSPRSPKRRTSARAPRRSRPATRRPAATC